MDKYTIVIVDATRTAIGNLGGSLSSVPAHHLGGTLIKKLVERNALKFSDIGEVIIGQVLTASQGQNPARQSSIYAGLDNSTTAYTINKVCGSGLKAIMLGAQSLMTTDASIIIAGGQENMSMAPHAIKLREPVKFGNAPMVDTMMYDGLTDAFSNIAMGYTAENIATKFNISRQEQDEFALKSQNKTEAAQKSGKFKDEISPYVIKNKKGDIVFDQDEFPRHGTTMESLTKLKPAFPDKEGNGSVTAGNASGINDGAAMVLLMTKEEAVRRNIKYMAEIKSFAAAGVDPQIMGTGPIDAVKKALNIAGWTTDMLDLIESNEAFAAQAICVAKELKFKEDILNVNGGAIALGHPIGASGARVLVSLVHEMQRRGSRKGLATLCIGGGMGVAMCIER